MELHHSAAACRIEWQATMHRWKDTPHLWVWKANLVVSLARQMRYCEQSKMGSMRELTSHGQTSMRDSNFEHDGGRDRKRAMAG
jgi:hypothetical protein